MANKTVDNFAAGICDNYLAAPPNASKEMHNFLINDDNKPGVRSPWIAFDTRVPVSGTNTRISGIYIESNPFNYPIVFRGDSAYRLNASSSFTEIVGPEGNVAIPGKAYNGFEACSPWTKQLIYCGNGSNTLPHRIICTSFSEPATFKALTLGLPAFATDPTVTSSGGAGTNNYVYALHRKYILTDYEGTEFVELGPVTFVSIALVDAPDVNFITVDDIPTLTNGTYTNYDVDQVTIQIYRTVNNGSSFYFVGEVANDGSQFIDTTPDSDLLDQSVLYTDGGLLDYNPPLAGTLYHAITNDFHWWATERCLYHSIQGAPGATPDEYQYFTEQPIRGLSSILSYPILFCDRSVYRVEGVYDEFGDGGFELKEISKVAGCVSNRSIVAVPGGLVFAGNGGFYFTDGYQVLKITVHLNIRYSIWKNESIAGVFDSNLNVVYWTVNSSANSAVNPNDLIAVLHLNQGLTQTSVFSTLASENNVFPNCVAYTESIDAAEEFRGKLIIGEAKGYLLTAEDLCYADSKLDVDAYISDFKLKTVIYRYESIGMDLGTDAVRCWVTSITTELDNQTDIACQYYSRRDDGGPWAALSEIRQDGAILWEISEYPWGDDDSDDLLHDWDSQSIIEARRGFPKGTLRSTRRQVALTNALTWVAKSDIDGLATTDTTAKTITLNDTSNVWPDDCEDYEVAFENDGYTYGYRVKSRVSDTVVLVYDPYLTLPAGSTLKWQMRGYRKFERLNLLSYTIFFDDDGATQAPSRGDAQYQNA